MGTLLALVMSAESLGGIEPSFLVKVDLSARSDFDRAAQLALTPIGREGNQFYLRGGPDLVGRLENARLPYEAVTNDEGLPTAVRLRMDRLAAAMAAGVALDHGIDQVPLSYCQPITVASAQQFSADTILSLITSRVSRDSLVAYARRLEALQTRFTFTDSVLVARDFIYDKFRSFGYTDVYYDTFSVVDYEFSPHGGDAYNIICTRRGSIDTSGIVILGAHYDSKVFWGDPAVYAPGADRNASGVAGVLEAARALAGIATRNTIMFIAFGAGEQGFWGSWELAKQMIGRDRQPVDLMINLDRIGFTSDAHPDLNINAGPESIAFARLALRLGLENTGLKSRRNETAEPSDWSPFAERGVHWLDLVEGDFNPAAQHTSDDLVDLLNPRYWAEVTKLAALTTYTVGTTPSAVESLTVADAGDGNSIVVRWAKLRGSDIVGYRVYWGTESGAYWHWHDIPAADPPQALIAGLAEGVPYYLSVAAIGSAGNESSVLPEAVMIPSRVPLAPVGVDAEADYHRIELAWDPALELDFDHYAVYRGVDSSAMTLYAPSVIATHFSDSAVERDIFHQYRVLSVDHDGNSSPLSAVVSARAATFDRGVLLLDMTRTAYGDPNDSTQETFYRSTVGGFLNQYYAYEQGGRQPINRSELGRYQALILIDDDVATGSWPPDYWAKLNWYLSFGNDLLIVGWSTPKEISGCQGDCAQLPGSALFDRFNIDRLYALAPIDCIGGHGVGGFPSVTFDPARVPPAWGGKLGFLWGFKLTGNAQMFMAYNSATNAPDREWYPVGVRRQVGANKLAILSLPLYYMLPADATALMKSVLTWFGLSDLPFGDLTGDYFVDVSDIRRLIDAVYWGDEAVVFYEPADINADCVLDVRDVVTLVDHVLLGAPLVPDQCRDGF